MLGSIYAMIGVALTLSIGVLKFLNFSIPGLFMIGGMSTWVFIRHGMPWPLAGRALAVGCASCSALSLAVMRNARIRAAGARWRLDLLITSPSLLGSELQSVPHAVRQRRPV